MPAAAKFSNIELATMSFESLKKKYTNLKVTSSQKIIWLKKEAWELIYELSENDFPVIIKQKVLNYMSWFYMCTYTSQANEKDIYIDKANELFGKMSIK